MLCTTPACFTTFWYTIVPTLVENSNFLVYLLSTFLEKIIMIMIILLVNPRISRHRVPQLYQLSSEKKTLRCWLCSIHYTVLRINNCLKRNQSSHYENYGWFPLQMEAITCIPQNWHFLWWAKMNGAQQRRVLVSPWRMHCMNSGIQKAPLGLKQCWTAKQIKPVSLAIVELRLSEGIRRLVRQLISQ